MALLVTLFLVLVNIFNSVTANAPKSEGLTAVETWVVMCILHVFCVLAEYAIILKIIQGEKIRARKAAAARPLRSYNSNVSANTNNTSTTSTSFVRLRTTDSRGPEQQHQLFDQPQHGHHVHQHHCHQHRQQQRPEDEQLQPLEAPDGRTFLLERSTNTTDEDTMTTHSQCSRHRHRQSVSIEARSTNSNNSVMPVADADTSWNKMDLTFLKPSTTATASGGGRSRRRCHRKTISVSASGPKFERIDRIAMWLFPIFFFLFNVAYWSYYLLLNEVFKNLW